MPITALYAGLLAPVLVYLAVRVINQRRAARVAIGHGEDAILLRRMRVHANFAEYVPMALVLMGLAENLKTTPILLYAMGITLLVGRVLHAYGVSQSKENLNLRVTGMALTFTAILMGSVFCLAAAMGFPIRF